MGLGEMVVGNVLLAAGLGLVAHAVSRLRGAAPWAHALWLTALLKLVTPAPFAPALGRTQVASGPAPAATSEPAAAPARPGRPSRTRTPPRPRDLERPSEPALAASPTGPLGVAPAPGSPGLGTVATWAILAAWALGAAFALWRAFRDGRRLRRLLVAAEGAPAWLHEEVAVLADRFGLRRPPRLGVVRAGVSPMVCAWPGGSWLLLPEHTVRGMPRVRRLTVVAHELAHLRRRDHLVRWVELLVGIVHWWNPVAAWIRRGLREAEEPCCDAWVLWALPGSRRHYADALVDVAAHLSNTQDVLPAAASGAGRAKNLSRRLRTMFSDPQPRTLSRALRPLALVTAALALSVTPTWSQEAERPNPRMEHVREFRAGLERLRREHRRLEEAGREDAAERVERRMHELELALERARRARPERKEPDPEHVLRALRLAADVLRHEHPRDARVLAWLFERVQRDVRREQLERRRQHAQGLERLRRALEETRERLEEAHARGRERQARALRHRLEDLERELHRGLEDLERELHRGLEDRRHEEEEHARGHDDDEDEHEHDGDDEHEDEDEGLRRELLRRTEELARRIERLERVLERLRR